MSNKPLVFISYSHKDEIWKDRLKPHLEVLEMAGQVVVWDDRQIDGGDKWYPEIENAMSQAAVAVCLISEHYLTSTFCVNEEIPFLLDREQKNNLLFIPVLISPCTWQAFRWLSATQMLPRDGQSILKDFKDDWSVAFVEVSDLIFKKINDPHYRLPVPTIQWEPPEKIDITRLPETGAELFGRETELTLLDDAWESEKTNVISFIAWGGVGKSTLINKWLGYMQEDHYQDAERIFAWSFYSQGTNERVTSADTFISEALQWFGDANPTSGSAWEKGQRLARLIQQKKTLLILDGMEPLQSSHEFERGKIKDQGLTALLRSLAQSNNGLCVITSREPVADLATMSQKSFFKIPLTPFEKKGEPQEKTFLGRYRYKEKIKQINLEKLSAHAGRALLRVGGVRGTDQELEDAVAQFGYHALAIKLLPVYLQNIPGHHISKALRIPDLNLPEEKGKHPRRVIAALSQCFLDQPAGELLQMLGFFDRPAQLEAIQKIMEPPMIAGLTDHLADTGEVSLWQAINTLRKENLLAQESKHRSNTLDCHPLIREHFADQLQIENPTAWQAAHARLYDYYKNLPDKELPDTLEEMEPLFAAVMHGCLAGKHQEALDDVFWNRIRRQSEGYSVKQLGAFGADLACLSNFFEKLWYQPVSSLTKADQAVILNWTGFALRAVGKLAEAAQPMEAGLKMRIEQNNDREAAKDSSNLGQLYLTLGDVTAAEKYGAQSVSYADRSEDDFQMEALRTGYADALHQAGQIQTAKELFMEAEAMQQNRQPDYPYLYGFAGFRFCDLLLSLGNHGEVLERAKQALDIVLAGSKNLLDIALNKLTIGKALMYLSPFAKGGRGDLDVSPFAKGGRGDLTEAAKYLNQAVDGLREAGAQHHLPRGLLARTTLFRHQAEFLLAWTDLEEVYEIAEYGQMRLHLTDYHLEAARLIQAQLAEGGESCQEFEVLAQGEILRLTPEGMATKFQEHVEVARQLIEETGYHRRDLELKDLLLSATK